MHTVASLLKLYLRELPEPVIPFHKYEEFLACAKLLSKDDEMVRKRNRWIGLFTDFIPPCKAFFFKVSACIATEVSADRLSHKPSEVQFCDVKGGPLLPGRLHPALVCPFTLPVLTSNICSHHGRGRVFCFLAVSKTSYRDNTMVIESLAN